MLRGEFGRRDQRLLGVAHAVVLLVARAQAPEDLDGLVDRRFLHVDLLEAAFERTVTLEGRLVLGVGRRADAAQLAARERRLEQVRGVHRAPARRPRADHGVDLVDEEDRAGLGLERTQDGLQALLELAAELRAGDERAHVQREDVRGAQRRRNLAGVDRARESLDDRGLADAGLAHEDGVVLAAPRENVDRALEFGGAADERVDLALRRPGDQVGRETSQGILDRSALVVGGAAIVGLLVRAVARSHLSVRFGIDAADAAVAVRDVAQRIESGHALLLEQEDRLATRLAHHGDDDARCVDFGPLGTDRVEGGALEHPLDARRLLRRARHPRGKALERLAEEVLQALAQHLLVHAELVEHPLRTRVVEQGEQQVLERQVFMAALARLLDGLAERSLQVGGDRWRVHVSATPAPGW